MKSNRFQKSLFGLLFALVLVATPPVRADDAQQDDRPVLLSRSFKAKEVCRIKSVVKATFNGMNHILESTEKRTIKEVKKNGDVVDVETPESLIFDGQLQPLDSSLDTILTRDKSGVLVDYREAGESMSSFSLEIRQLLTSLAVALLSNKPVKTDDSWETKFKNPAVKGKKVLVKTTYLGADRVEANIAWKLKQTGEVEVNDQGAKMRFEATFWLDPNTGQMLKQETNFTDIPTLQGYPLSLSITASLVEPETASAPVATKTDR